MEPEIARRCPDCGASVRGGSAFCPQCGKALKAGAANASPAAEVTETQAQVISEDGRFAPSVAPPESVPEAAPTVEPAQETPPSVAVSEDRRRPRIIPPDAEVHDDGRSKRQRMTAAARDAVEEKLSPRVEKLRHASNVMLEEASYDPSLRFVLVAVAIILLSLLLLLLNYLLG